jgi:hypothetical protein
MHALVGMKLETFLVLSSQFGSQVSAQTLPPLPKNARYLFHQNECFDWGSVGWAIRTGMVNTRKYKYFFFMNSSVRGPFLPSYHEVRVFILSNENAIQ